MGSKRLGLCARCAALAMLTMFAASCIRYTNQSFWEDARIKVQLEGDNFRVVKLGVRGTASCPYLFGGLQQFVTVVGNVVVRVVNLATLGILGGPAVQLPQPGEQPWRQGASDPFRQSQIIGLAIPLGNPNLLSRAMRDLHQRSGIQGRSAFLHNVSVEWRGGGVPFFLLVQRVTIMADVVEFHKEYLDYKPRP